MGVRWRSRWSTLSYPLSVWTQGWIQRPWTTQKVLSLWEGDVGREGIVLVLALTNWYNVIYVDELSLILFKLSLLSFYMQHSAKKMFDVMFLMWMWSCCKRINALMCVFAVAGVIYVCVHSATKVIASDYGGLSDPYCVVFSDRRRVRVISLFIPIKLR